MSTVAPQRDNYNMPTSHNLITRKTRLEVFPVKWKLLAVFVGNIQNKTINAGVTKKVQRKRCYFCLFAAILFLVDH